MAPYIDRRAQRRAEDFKAFLYQLALSTDNNQQDIAFAVGTEQGVVSQWMNPKSERNFPAHAISALPLSMALPTLQYLLSQIKKPDMNNLDGSINDEMIRAVFELGKLAECDQSKAPLGEFVLHADELKSIIDRMIAEKQGQSK